MGSDERPGRCQDMGGATDLITGPTRFCTPFCILNHPKYLWVRPIIAARHSAVGVFVFCTFYVLFVGRERDMLFRRCSGSSSLLLQIQFLPRSRSLLRGVRIWGRSVDGDTASRCLSVQMAWDGNRAVRSDSLLDNRRLLQSQLQNINTNACIAVIQSQAVHLRFSRPSRDAMTPWCFRLPVQPRGPPPT
jgi:hypothetical protein